MKAATVKSLRQEAKGIAFVLPALILLIVFCIYPMAYAVRTSFFNWNMTSTMKYVGLKNYVKFFTNKTALHALSVTFQYMLWTLPASLILGFLLALLVNKPSKRHVIARTLVFIPHVASVVAVCAVWQFLYNPQYGFINSLLALVGIPAQRFLNDPRLALGSIAVVYIWRQAGYNMIIFIGGIQAITSEVLEAATIDGASKRQVTWHVILPLVMPTGFMLMILNTIGICKMYTLIESLTEGGPAKSTMNLIYLIQQTAFTDYSIGYAFAMSVVLFVIILLVNVFQMSLEKYVSYDA